jgi:hypothetical protein
MQVNFTVGFGSCGFVAVEARYKAEKMKRGDRVDTCRSEDCQNGDE